MKVDSVLLPCIGNIKGGVSIYCRSVVCIYGAHLKGKYKGMMFISICMNGNNNIFHLAGGIGNPENDPSWLWFFTKFKEVYGNHSDLVTVLDRHPSIGKAIHEVYLEANYYICMQHLLSNSNNKVREFSIDILYYPCAKAYRLC